jgi:hypothetical protein
LEDDEAEKAEEEEGATLASFCHTYNGRKMTRLSQSGWLSRTAEQPVFL